jgi:CspA family cold shock protein
LNHAGLAERRNHRHDAFVNDTDVTGERAVGVVRVWHAEEGWGVVDSEETPGGCWVHFSAIDASGYRGLRAGQQVMMVFEAAEQDGYAYRAVHVEVLKEGHPGA